MSIIRAQVEEGWWRGKIGSKVGVFPSNFVIALENVSPILANRRITTNTATAILNSSSITSSASLGLTKQKGALSNSKEDLTAPPPSYTSLLSSLDKDAPTLPPKPGNLCIS